MNDPIYSISDLQSDADNAAQRAVIHGVEQPCPSYLYGTARSIWLERYHYSLEQERAGREAV